MPNPMIDNIIDHLWSWIRTNKDHDAIKDTTKLGNVKFDCYINSSVSDPVAFTVFELSDKGEIIVDDITRLMESQAAFFLFVNTKSGWMLWIKNTPENVKKIVKKEEIQNFKVRIIQ